MPSAKKADTSAFWDTSGLALLCVHQPATGVARRVAQRCRAIATWWATPVEARSVFQRLQREGALNSGEVAASAQTPVRIAPVELQRSFRPRRFGEPQKRCWTRIRCAQPTRSNWQRRWSTAGINPETDGSCASISGCARPQTSQGSPCFPARTPPPADARDGKTTDGRPNAGQCPSQGASDPLSPEKSVSSAPLCQRFASLRMP